MSRQYEMILTVKKYRKSKDEAIARAAQKEWPWQGGLTLPRHTVNPNTGNPPGNEIYGLAQSNLCGGETEEEFANRLAKAINKANGKPCQIEIQAINLDNPPCETFNFNQKKLPKVARRKR